MKLTVKDSKGAVPKCGLLAVLAPEGEVDLPKGVTLPPASLREFEGKFRQTRASDAVSGPAERVLLVGLGEGESVDAERLRRASGLAARAAIGEKREDVTLFVDRAAVDAAGGPEAAGRAVAEGLAMGSYVGGAQKSRDRSKGLLRATLIGPGAGFDKGARHGLLLAEANAFARDLQETPGNLMRPRDLVAAARKLAAKSQRITVRVLDEATMKKMGMGSLLSVSRGSREPAYLIHLTYRPTKKPKGKVAFVGKGLTFDAGGISLKPAAKMHEMKYDMSGGAAVLGVFHALAKLDVPFEVHGVVPASENLPDGDANKPGDVVTASNGLTIEVLNTDAEGRLILADALVYTSRKVKPDTIVDLATLTGAVVVALGHELSGMMTPDDDLAGALLSAGEATGERLWRLPLMDCHKDQMKGSVGDLRNINAGQGAGSTAGAAFLSNFVEKAAWAHLDIAGTAWGAEDRDYVGGELGTGVGVRLLLRYLEERA